MTKSFAPRVDLRTLKVAATKFASGGQAELFALTDDPSTVFKKFLEPEKHDWDAIEHLVALPASMAAHDRALIEALSAWPISVVTRDNQQKGTLMRRIPVTCRIDVRTLKKESTIDARLSQLMFADSQARQVLGVTECRTTGWKLRTLLRSAQFLNMLHKKGLRFGDISDANWLFNTAAARPFFIDCDGIRTSSEPAKVQTPDWRTAQNLGGIAGDNHRFFFGAYRLIGELNVALPSTDGINAIEQRLGALAIVDTLRAALTEPGAISPAEWISSLWSSMEHAGQSALIQDLLEDGWPQPILEVVPSSDHNFSHVRLDALRASHLEADTHALLASANPDLSDYLDTEDKYSAPPIARFRRELSDNEKTISARLSRIASEPSAPADLIRDGHHGAALKLATRTQAAPSHLLDLAFRMHLGHSPLEHVRITRDRYLFFLRRPDAASKPRRITVQWNWPGDLDITAARVNLNGAPISVTARGTASTSTCHLIANLGDLISVEAGGIPPGRTQPIFESSQSQKEAV